MSEGLSRRNMIVLGLGVAGVASGGFQAAKAKELNTSILALNRDPFAAINLQSDLEAYDGFGVHRSGGLADRATTDWMEDLWCELGYRTERQNFTVPNHDALDATLDVEGAGRISLSAQPPFKAQGSVHGRLVYLTSASVKHQAPDGLSGHIIVADTEYGRHSRLDGQSTRPFVEFARQSGAAALILITNGPSRDVAFLNIDLESNYPLIALANPSKSAALRSAALAGVNARLQTPSIGAPRIASNLIGSLQRSGPHIVISTPMSGWTHCAAERGPGIAAMRALSRWLPSAFPNHSITLFCSSGHELTTLGGRLWLDAGAPDPVSTALWLHLGAGWAARDWHETPSGLLPLDHADAQRYLMASPNILEDVSDAFTGVPGLAETYPLTAETAAGELKHIAGHGYKTIFGAFGAHRLHHVMSDRMNAVSGALVEKPTLAFRDAIQSICQPDR